MKPLHANDIAANFAARLAADLTTAQLDQISDRNAAEANPEICHSHDFSDANVYMQAAFEQVLGREMDLHGDDDLALWAEAFAKFRFHGSRVGRALQACGFKLDHQGGGFFNWRKEVAPGLDLFACDGDGQEPEDLRPCEMGIALAASDTLAVGQFETGSKLAQSLNARQ